MRPVRAADGGAFTLLAVLLLSACEYVELADLCSPGDTYCGDDDTVEHCEYNWLLGIWGWSTDRHCESDGLRCEMVDGEATCVP